jgi:septal ring factor EnvC (AmiA/AmiB activator)
MGRFDDEYEGSDESEDTDPTVRELRAQIVRLQAHLDQLTASVREQAGDSARISAKLAELEGRIARLEARRRSDSRLMRLLSVLFVVSLALSSYTCITYLMR